MLVVEVDGAAAAADLEKNPRQRDGAMLRPSIKMAKRITNQPKMAKARRMQNQLSPALDNQVALLQLPSRMTIGRLTTKEENTC
jgi:hypothetical protein